MDADFIFKKKEEEEEMWMSCVKENKKKFYELEGKQGQGYLAQQYDQCLTLLTSSTCKRLGELNS